MNDQNEQETLYKVLRRAEEDLRERWEDYDLADDPYPEDTLHEIADGNVPIYTSDLMEVAADNLDMATLEPELGPAFNGEPTPVNIIAANIYEALTAHLYEALETLKEGKDQ